MSTDVCTRCQGPKRKSNRTTICSNCWTPEDATAYAKQWRKDNQEHLQKHKRERGYVKKYGVSIDKVDALILAQDGKCAICLKTEKLQLEHDHVTNKVRGMICNYCNMCLGWFERMGPDTINNYLAGYAGFDVDETKFSKRQADAEAQGYRALSKSHPKYEEKARKSDTETKATKTSSL